MAKKAGKSSTGKSSSLKKKKKKKKKGSSDTGQDPPIIIKSGALPGADGESYAMEMYCHDPMDFYYSPASEPKWPNQYSYSDTTLGEITEIVLTVGGTVVCTQKVEGEEWELTIFSASPP